MAAREVRGDQGDGDARRVADGGAGDGHLEELGGPELLEGLEPADGGGGELVAEPGLPGVVPPVEGGVMEPVDPLVVLRAVHAPAHGHDGVVGLLGHEDRELGAPGAPPAGREV